MTATTLPQVAPLPDGPDPGADPQRVADEILHIVTEAITRHPRSLQKMIGPSEIGNPCARALGYKMLGTPERPQPPNWKATVGTAVHAWLETVFDQSNYRWAGGNDGQERWYIESRVHVGDIGGQSVTGTADLFDRTTLTNWDWKTCSPSMLKHYRANGPSDTYRTQAHLYGLGWMRAGIGCEHVGIIFLPRNGDLAEAVVWHEPFNPLIAAQALQRIGGIHAATSAAGPAALEALPTHDHYCHTCPFYRAGSTDLATGCPGHPDAAANTPGTQLDGLIPSA